MTTIKRILAVMLAVMLIASIGIIGASAAGEKLTLSSDKEGFTYTIYKVATLDLSTGKYTASGNVDVAVSAAINTPNQSGAAFLTVLDSAANVGTPMGTLSEGTKEITAPGIYYAKVTEFPSTTTKKSNSVIVWPEYNNNKYTLSNVTVDLGKKVDSGTDNVTKYFSEDTAQTVTSKSAAQGDVINFTLEADVVGSADQQLSKFVIWDKMSKGLTYNNDAKVYYDSETTATTDFDIAATALTDSDAYYNGGTYITATAKAAALSGTAFYSHTKVYVKYSATVNNSAAIGKDYNPNKNGMTYNTGSGSDVDKSGREVKVYTYEVQAIKYDGSKSPKVALAGAKFGLFKGGDKIAEGTSAADGKIVFKSGTDANGLRLAPGEYVVKELAAPNGYALSTVETKVTVNDTKSGTGITFVNGDDGIDNYPTKLPETGGMGTMMFTIIGGMLVLLAGAMFVIVMKKRASSK